MVTPLIKIIPDFSTTLASKVAIAATTASLSTATDSNGDTLATGKYGFTIDRKNSSKEYFTATLTGTSLTNIATIDITDGTETSGLAKAHRKGAEIIISDFVAIKRIQDVLETGYVDTYVPTTDYQIATKAYADGLTIGGAPNADETTKGIVEIATVAEINSGATNGTTGASLVITPSSLSTSTYATRLTSLETTVGPIRRVYTANGTWTKPAGLKYIEVELQGGGAGSNSRGRYGSNPGHDGGNTSFGSHCSATGSTVSGNKGVGVNGDLNLDGNPGFSNIGSMGGFGGNGFLNNYGKGGAGAYYNYGSYSNGDGGLPSSGYCKKLILASSLGATEAYVVGLGGLGGAQNDSYGGPGENGGNGIIILTEHYF